MIDKDGNVLERTNKDGKLFGLNRQVHKDEVRVFLAADGVEIAHKYFDKNFNITDLQDPDNLLGELNPQTFKRDGSNLSQQQANCRI